MPVHVIKRGKGAKPWKIVEVATGRIVGESATIEDAKASARIRNAAHFNKLKGQKA